MALVEEPSGSSDLRLRFGRTPEQVDSRFDAPTADGFTDPFTHGLPIRLRKPARVKIERTGNLDRGLQLTASDQP
jgi:hypothetical protein